MGVNFYQRNLISDMRCNVEDGESLDLCVGGVACWGGGGPTASWRSSLADYVL